MSQAEAWTVGRLLQWTADYLKQKGSSTPRLDAEVLLAQARGCQRIQLYTAFHETPADDVRNAFKTLVKQRAEGTPVAYLVGRREFFSLEFRVTPDVLIPRPETELVVMTVLDLIQRQTASTSAETISVADVGTGSGIIAISIAKHAPQARITAIDISEAALKVASENVERHGVGEQVTLLAGDLLSTVPAEARFEIIASNPPYVSAPEMATVAAEAARHEPHLALLGGPSGTEVIDRLRDQAGEHLASEGWLVMEISPMIADAVCASISGDSRFGSCEVRKDLAGLARVVCAQRLAG